MVIIKIHYGQYAVCSIVAYRTQRLYGLTAELTRQGHQVELIPSKHWDRVEIEVAGRNIFTCRLTFLEFNCEVNGDPLASRAIKVINDTLEKIVSAVPERVPSKDYSVISGGILAIRRSIRNIIDACSRLSVEISSLVNKSMSYKTLENIKKQSISWAKELPAGSPELDDLEELIESCSMIADNWSLYEALSQKICSSCSECVPFCQCPEPKISYESLKEACSVCGPYCICEKRPSEKITGICPKCGPICTCSEGSDEDKPAATICDIVIPKRAEDDKEEIIESIVMDIIQPPCPECGLICECPSELMSKDACLIKSSEAVVTPSFTQEIQNEIENILQDENQAEKITELPSQKEQEGPSIKEEEKISELPSQKEQEKPRIKEEEKISELPSQKEQEGPRIKEEEKISELPSQKEQEGPRIKEEEKISELPSQKEQEGPRIKEEIQSAQPEIEMETPRQEQDHGKKSDPKLEEDKPENEDKPEKEEDKPKKEEERTLLQDLFGF